MYLEQIAIPPFAIHYLEDFENAHVRASLLGSLAENLMTIGQVSGRFVCCHDCGTTMATKEPAFACACCGRTYELKPDAQFRPKGDAVVTRFLLTCAPRLEPVSLRA